MPQNDKHHLLKEFFKYAAVAGLAISALGAFYYLSTNNSYTSGVVIPQKLSAAAETGLPVQVVPVNPYENASTTAKAIFVYDPLADKILYEKNADYEMPLASLTKIMTAIVAAESLQEMETVTIKREALSMEGDSGLLVDEVWNNRSLAAFGLINSSNDGMQALAIYAGEVLGSRPSDGFKTFVDAMNSKSTALGFSNTKFFNPTGLDIRGGINGAYSTAREISKLMWYGYQNHKDIFQYSGKKSESFVSESNIKHEIKNTNPLTKEGNIIASKTGFTELAGGNLVVVFSLSDDRKIVATVLGSTYEDRFKDMSEIIRITLETQ